MGGDECVCVGRKGEGRPGILRVGKAEKTGKLINCSLIIYCSLN